MVTGSPKDLRLLALAGGALVALACGHTDPFSTPPYGTTQPFDATPPVRLTLNQGADRGASWLPDGSGIIYSSQQIERPDADVCLAELPPTGGSQRRLVCDLSRLGVDTTNAIEWPAVSAEGRLAFVKASGSVRASGPSREALSVATGLDPSAASDVQRIPYTAAGEPSYSAIVQPRWQRETQLVFVGAAKDVRQQCSQCRVDTILTGLRVAVFDLSSTGAAPVMLAGTDFASGATPGPSSDEVYFTLGGDTRVYRRVLSTGETHLVHDFGAAGIARDVHLAGGRLVAIVGGRVAFSVDPKLGPTQWDSGGVVHVLDLGSDADVALDGPGLFRRPVMAPTGDRVVAEGYPLIIQDGVDPITGFPKKDTTVSRAGDLYLFTTP
jgi:hypothetical protein